MEQIPFPNKKYQIIYADPPWRLILKNKQETYYKKAFEELCKDIFYIFDEKILFSYRDGDFYLNNSEYSEETKNLIKECFKNEKL